ncbi:hypothetical protein MSTO_09690 [Mycobacterium stomatepiae]|uniref:Uncharacterized protein n=1 Tax=Mycobacterium stomatepiae TaxID=470076 RepID=A0A7I7Q306_9MYCO|nr:hypothetical protein MSTO_09690 [Mycobacterium stomatepiae]
MPTSVPLPVAVRRVSCAACYLTARAGRGPPADAEAGAVVAAGVEGAALEVGVPVVVAVRVPPVVVPAPAVAAAATPAVVVEEAVPQRVARVAVSSAPAAAAADRV